MIIVQQVATYKTNYFLNLFLILKYTSVNLIFNVGQIILVTNNVAAALKAINAVLSRKSISTPKSLNDNGGYPNKTKKLNMQCIWKGRV